jgi:hypothetical protein
MKTIQRIILTFRLLVKHLASRHRHCNNKCGDHRPPLQKQKFIRFIRDIRG